MDPLPPSTLSHELHQVDIWMIAIMLISMLLVGVHASIEANGLTWLSALRNFVSWWSGSGKSDSSRAAQYAHDSTSQHSEMAEGGTETLSTDAGNHQVESATKNGNLSNFFLADRSMKFYFVGASLFASNIGSEHFVGQAGDGARRGIGVAIYEWYATFLLLALGWVFAPLYARAGIYTTPQFLEQRFNRHCRTYLSVITCIMYVVTKMSASIYGGAVILSAALGWDLYISAGACIFLSALYTMSGGLRAVMYTDLMQTIVFTVGGLVVMAATLDKVGGFQGLRERLEERERGDHWTLLKSTSDEDYPWTGMLIGQPMASLWYWCLDQDIVQRTLSAKSDVHAKAGCVMASALKLLGPLFMVVPGMAVSVLYDFTDEDAVSTDKAYPILLTSVMPTGIVGIMIGSVMAAMMSSLDSVFNAGSTVFTFDVYARAFPHSSDAALERVGRIATLVFAVLSFLWIPVISGGDGLYRQVVELQSYLTPPMGVVFLIGVCWRRATGAGALAGLLSGGLFGIVRMLVSFTVDSETVAAWPPVWRELFSMNFQHYAIFLWVCSAVFCVAVSLMTDAPDIEQVEPFLIRWSDLRLRLGSEAEQGARSWVQPLLQICAIAIVLATISLAFVFQ